jgi:hypothetical protein
MKKFTKVWGLAAVVLAALVVMGCASTKYALDGAKYEAITSPYTSIDFYYSDTSGLTYYAYPVSVDGHELPEIKKAGKDLVEFRVPSSILPLKMKVHVYTRHKTGLDLMAMAKNAIKGKDNIDEDIEFTIPAAEAGRDTELFTVGYIETEGLAGGDLSALNDLAGGKASVQEALFGQQFWALYLIRGQSEPDYPGAVKIPYRNSLVRYVIQAKSF